MIQWRRISGSVRLVSLKRKVGLRRLARVFIAKRGKSDEFRISRRQFQSASGDFGHGLLCEPTRNLLRNFLRQGV